MPSVCFGNLIFYHVVQSFSLDDGIKVYDGQNFRMEFCTIYYIYSLLSNRFCLLYGIVVCTTFQTYIPFHKINVWWIEITGHCGAIMILLIFMHWVSGLGQRPRYLGSLEFNPVFVMLLRVLIRHIKMLIISRWNYWAKS